ncbi:hypothetical protein B0T25DRAFT_529734 [Lasiosphaeria hispida]|uniref:Uncharacterized protein n=1 Tax=Lasiosphaeria hispida TaxID=260671 RepID=A0AAJ0HX45_9PEZI|nr:hypothetical protein B0T25DRAFT_529734 [Lasiosphaeria hispida]
MQTVYAPFHDEKTGFNSIIQENMSGQPGCRNWKTLDIIAQLRRYFDELRSLPSSGYGATPI